MKIKWPSSKVVHFDSFPAFSEFLQVIQFVYNTISIDWDLRGGNIILYKCIPSSLSKSVRSLAFQASYQIYTVSLSIVLNLRPLFDTHAFIPRFDTIRQIIDSTHSITSQNFNA